MRLRPLHEGFGVEVLDVDLLGTVDDSQIEALRAAFNQHQFLLFRVGRALEPERQIEIMEWFGDVLEDNGSRWGVLDNDTAAGSIRLPFHSDFTYTDHPLKAISLQAIAVPEGGTSTSYVSGASAWSTLLPERQQFLADLTLRHRHVSVISSGWPEFIALHPLRLLHPRTGRPVLFITEHHADRILDLDEAQSDEVIEELFAHMYAPQQVYRHQWRLHDFVIWDNIAIQHAREEEAAPSAGKRTVQRVCLGDIPLSQLIEIARDQERRRRELQEA